MSIRLLPVPDSSNHSSRNGSAHLYTLLRKYKMAAEGVMDGCKNESGIPRAVFVVRNSCLLLKVAFRLGHICENSLKIS